jgi:hypothetical protein
MTPEKMASIQEQLEQHPDVQDVKINNEPAAS